MITKQEIKRSLGLMGIVPGDTLLLHSAMTAIGGVEGGADSVIDAFLETIGEEGTLVMSTLTGWFAPFDAATSPSAVGYLCCAACIPSTLSALTARTQPSLQKAMNTAKPVAEKVHLI